MTFWPCLTGKEEARPVVFMTGMGISGANITSGDGYVQGKPSARDPDRMGRAGTQERRRRTGLW